MIESKKGKLLNILKAAPLFFTKLSLISPGRIGVYLSGVIVIAINLVN